MKTELKGYALSNDHEKLWDLLQDGYKIPIIMPYRFHPNMPLAFGRTLIGGEVFVEGYYDYIRTNDKKTFLKECKEYNLHFIPPIEN